MTSRTYPNGVSTTYEYDGMSRLKRLKDASQTATLFDRQYSYNNASQISQITEPTLTRMFGYDNVDRLTSVTASNNQNENYNFDDVGNRISSHRSATYGYQPYNKVITTATANYVYDANGNMVSKAEGTNFWRYGFDYENRLVSASTRKQTVRYRYDALGRRVQRFIVGGKENTKFIYDGQDVLIDDNSGTLAKYINGAGIDNKLRVQTGSDVKYFLSDHLGSTNGLTDASGNLTAQTNYDAFGNATNANFPNRYQFTGREYDSFTGLHYYRARFYDGNLGRFISEDPIGFEGGLNWYVYVENRPLMFRDPEGKAGPLGIALIFGGVGAVAGGVGSIAGQMLRNYVCGKNLFDIDWLDVGIATGVGALAGAAYPFVGVFPGGSTALGAIANTSQYLISEYAHGRSPTWGGAGIAAGTGAVAGAIAGPYGVSTVWGSRVAFATAANAEESVLMNLSRSALGRAFGSATTSNTTWQDIFQCACNGAAN